LLANIQVAPFHHLPQAIQILDNLLSRHSVLLELLHLIKANTSSIRGEYTQVYQSFSVLNDVASASKISVQYDSVLKTLVALRDYLTALANSPNMAQAEFQDAVAILQHQLPNNPIVLLYGQAQQLPAPLNTWFTQIAEHSMGLLLQGAHQVVNNAWHSKVIPYYSSHIKDRFPFHAEISNVVNMTDFATFFGSNGILSQFFQNYLAPFIDTAHGGIQYTFGEHSLGLSDYVLQQLNHALLIRNMYFTHDDNIPNLQFSIKPLYLNAAASSVSVQLDNQTLIYRHGPQQFIHWQWPLLEDLQQVGVSFSDFQGRNYSRNLDGPWAWLVLLRSGSLEKAVLMGRYIWTIQNGSHKARFELSAPNNLPVFDLQLLESLSLPNNI